MEQILLPTTIEFLDGDNPNAGQVVITPCHQGDGTTLGNALRRVRLSSLPGAADESVKINGVQHEFAAIEGAQEDVVEIILNLKQVSARCFSETPVTLSLRKKGKGEVTAGDFEKNSDVEIVNPEAKIFTITDDKKVIEMEITIGRGRGYVPVEEKDLKNLDLGTILVDSLYTPIRDVGYKVELTRVGDVTDYEKLVLNIETNGTITPREAVSSATTILMDHLALLAEAAESGMTEKGVEAEANKPSEQTAKEDKEIGNNKKEIKETREMKEIKKKIKTVKLKKTKKTK